MQKKKIIKLAVYLFNIEFKPMGHLPYMMFFTSIRSIHTISMLFSLQQSRTDAAIYSCYNIITPSVRQSHGPTDALQ